MFGRDQLATRTPLHTITPEDSRPAADSDGGPLRHLKRCVGPPYLRPGELSRQQAKHGKAFLWSRCCLARIGRKPDRLADRELVCWHQFQLAGSKRPVLVVEI